MYFKRYTRTLNIFSSGDFHIIAICLDRNTKSQCWSDVAFFYRALVRIFAFTVIYPWLVFALLLLVSALAHASSSCIYFAKVFISAYASKPFTSLFLAFSILHCSTVLAQWLGFFSSFSCTHFLSSVFSQEPFWIFISVIFIFISVT